MAETKTFLRRKDEGQLCLPLVGSRLYEWHDQKKGLTRAGLLMEVADDPGPAGFNHANIAALQLLKSKLQGQLNGAGPPIWYSGFKPPFAPPEPSPFASICVERPNRGSSACCVR